MTFTVEQVARRYAVGPKTVLGWIARGDLRAINVARRYGAGRPSWRVTERALAAFEEVRAASPAPVARPPRRKQAGQPMKWY